MRFSTKLIETHGEIWKILIIISHKSGSIKKDPIFRYPVSTWYSRGENSNQEHRACISC